MDACSSLFAYCVERLGYSEDGATKRVRVARLVQRFPQVLDELASGEVHLTGLFLLSGHLTEDNAEQLLAEARGKSKRQLEELIARWFPRPDVPPTITPVTPEPAQGESSTWSGTGNPAQSAQSAQSPRPRVEPLSPARVRVEFTERDGGRCTFTDAEGRRCSEKRFLTIEHIHPFAKGGPTTVENCSLLCQAHNSFQARQVFGEEHFQDKIAEARASRDANSAPEVPPEPAAPAPPAPPAALPERDVSEKVLGALVHSGFKRSEARRALEQVRSRGVEPLLEPMLRAAFTALAP